MSRRRFFRKGSRDKAEAPIIRAHELAGDTVHQLGGKDTPDLLIGSGGKNHLVEVKSHLEGRHKRKDGTERSWASKGKLRPGQERFRSTWKGAPVIVAYTPEESLVAVGHPPEVVQRALKELVVAEADGGNRLQVVRLPGPGRNRAPRNNYTPPPTTRCRQEPPEPGCCLPDPCAACEAHP